MNNRIEQLESALKVIRIWAAFDQNEGHQIALIPEHVIKFCDKALNLKKSLKEIFDGLNTQE